MNTDVSKDMSTIGVRASPANTASDGVPLRVTFGRSLSTIGVRTSPANCARDGDTLSKNSEVDDDTDLPVLDWNNKEILDRKREIEKKDNRYFHREHKRMIDEDYENLKRLTKFEKKLRKIMDQINNTKCRDEKIKIIKCMLNIFIENLDILDCDKYFKLKQKIRDKLLNWYHVEKFDCKEYFQKIFYEDEDIESFS
jgi:hypothetical protein